MKQLKLLPAAKLNWQERIQLILNLFGFDYVLSMGGACLFQVEAINTKEALGLYFRGRSALSLEIFDVNLRRYKELSQDSSYIGKLTFDQYMGEVWTIGFRQNKKIYKNIYWYNQGYFGYIGLDDEADQWLYSFLKDWQQSQ